MAEAARVEPEGEPPVNPYSLLEAVNASSDTVHTGWLIFILIMAYLTIAVAGVSHKDLLLETRVELPILQVKIAQAQFFLFAPVLLVLFHIGIVSQLVLLARKALEFDQSVRALEFTHRRTHPLRLELHNFFFVQAVAGPQRSFIMSAFLHGMSWLTLVALPVILLLYVQISFLPYHDADVTWMHRICLVVDIAMLILIGIFLMRADTSFFRAFWRTGRRHPLGFGVTALMLTTVALFSFFVATVPGEPLDRLGQQLLGSDQSAGAERERTYAVGFATPYLSRADGSLLGVFHRNLIVTNSDLAANKDAAAEAAPVSLRGRDLRNAKLDRSNLHKADLTGADLTGASLVGADLRHARLQCVDINELILSGDRAQAGCASVRDAKLTRAQMAGVRLTGADMRAANLEEANLEGAELAHALMTGANFSSARLDKADLTGGVQLQGANFLLASLPGADLTGAHLEFADFTSAAMPGAGLRFAYLYGAKLSGADLEGAVLNGAKLQGANLSGAKLSAADLRGARVWQTLPPNPDGLISADLAELVRSPLKETEDADFRTMMLRIEDSDLPERLKDRLREALASFQESANNGTWENSPEQKSWQRFVAASNRALPEDYRKEITEYLAKFMCKWRRDSGAVAEGIVRRARDQAFRGDLPALFDRLQAKECSASDKISKKVVEDLKFDVETLRDK